jgi:hypothetical protein
MAKERLMSSTAVERAPSEQPRKPEPEQVVVETVLDQLGRPKNLFRTHAREVWKNQYRVNVYCTMETDRPVRTVSITDSFFVTVTDAGIVSEPTITRKYR